jgi:hypothetical protein
MAGHYEVTLEADNLHEGAEVVVQGLGVLVNGSTVEFSKELVEHNFRTVNSTLEDVFGDDKNPGVVTERKVVPGPKLEDAASGMPGTVTVKYVDDDDSKANAKDDEKPVAAKTAAASGTKKEGDK